MIDSKVLARGMGAGLLTLALAGCASTGDPGIVPSLEERLERQGLQKGASVTRVPSFGISGWSYLDRRHVLVDSGPGRSYLIGMRNDCDELAYADRLGYTTTAGSLTTFDRLRARSNSGWPIDCGIHTIHELQRIERSGAGAAGVDTGEGRHSDGLAR